MKGCIHCIYLLFFSTVLLTGGCATLPKDFERPVTYAYTDTDDTLMGTYYRDEIIAHPGKSGFYLLGNGLDAFLARAALASQAERSIDTQYYMIHSDLTGRLFIDQLIKAADRGVRVRLLVDDIDMGGKDLGAAVLDSHPNIEVRLFNPFSRNTFRTPQYVTRLGSVTRRMHNKSFTVDNQISILGGRNIGDDYFDADPEMAFSDMDVLAVGPVAKEVSASFDLYWNNELAYPALVLKGKPPTADEIKEKHQVLNEFIAQQQDSVYLFGLRNSKLADKIRKNQVDLRWGEALVVYDKPEKLTHDVDSEKYRLTPQLRPYKEALKKELIIFSPYFVPGKEGTEFLSQLREKGVRVRILTNSLASTDVGLVHAGYSKYRKKLLRAGVELFEMNKSLSRKERKEKKGEKSSSKASLHAKSFVFDREHVFIGSLNLDPRSVAQNTEIGVVFESAEIASEMGQWFDQNVERLSWRLELVKNEEGVEHLLWHGTEGGQPRTFNVEPNTGFWRRFGIGFMRIMPIESQL